MKLLLIKTEKLTFFTNFACHIGKNTSGWADIFALLGCNIYVIYYIDPVLRKYILDQKAYRPIPDKLYIHDMPYMHSLLF